MSSMSDTQRERVAQHTTKFECPFCEQLPRERRNQWKVLGVEHFGVQSGYASTVGVACARCGYLAFFLLESCT